MPALWQSNSVSPAALAAPAINKLCGQILGNPADIRFLVGEEGATLQAQSLVDLDIQAIDFLRLMDGETGGGDLERLIAYQFRQAQNLTDDSQISISFKDRDASWSDSVRTLFDLAPMIRSLQEIISESKATYADDLLIPGESAPNPGGLIPEEFEARVNLAYNTLDFIQINLSNQTYSNNGDLKVSMSNAELDIIRTSLLDASQFGIANAVPIHGSGNTDKIVATLAAQSDATIKAIGKRLAEATKKISNIAPSATEKKK